MNGGTPPTAPNALTGLLTPPGKIVFARRYNSSERVNEPPAVNVGRKNPDIWSAIIMEHRKIGKIPVRKILDGFIP